jgi:hypothetical protein
MRGVDCQARALRAALTPDFAAQIDSIQPLGKSEGKAEFNRFAVIIVVTTYTKENLT